MVKLTELRIGNLLMDSLTGEYLSASELDSNGKIVATVINRDKYPLPDGWSLSPIPLTPEILERFGFQKQDENTYTIGENPLTHDYKMVIKWSNITKQFFYNNGYYSVKYVHQLQNLYNALTGDELKLPNNE